MKTEIYFKQNASYKKYITKDGNYDASNIHLLGNGGVPTASFLFKSKYVDEIQELMTGCICRRYAIKVSYDRLWICALYR